MFAYDRRNLETVRHKDENGFLHVDVSNITKETVNPYYGREIPGYQELHLDPDKIYYGYRPGEELDRAAITFNNLPMLSRHVEDGSKKNTKHLRIGSLGDRSKFVSPYVKNSLVIYDGKEIDLVESDQKKELSCAYRYEPVFESGVFDGKKYDFRMTNIRGNHVALVEEGRAGSDVVVADENTIKGVKTKMKQKLQNFFSKAKIDTLAQDEGLEEAFKEAVKEGIREEIEVMSSEEEKETKEVIEADEDTVDKREEIDDVGGFLKSKGLSDEDIRIVMSKMEKAAYDKSKARDSSVKEDQMGKDEDKKEDDVKAMDAAITKRLRSIYDAVEDVRPLIGTVQNPMAFDSSEHIYKKALTLNKISLTGIDPSSYKAMVGVLKAKKGFSPLIAQDSKKDGIEDQFENLKKIKKGE